VTVTNPKVQPLAWTIEQPATIEPLESVPIVAKLPGYIQAIAPDEAALKSGVKLPGGQMPVLDIGSEVTPGQLLATLSIPELDAEADEKAAAVERSKAELKQAEANIAVTAAQFASAEAFVKETEAAVARADADVTRWKAELDQVNAQIMGGVADTQTRTVITKGWDAARAAKLEAEAKVVTARAQAKERIAFQAKAEADVEAAKSRVKQAEAEAMRTESLRSYTRLVAPPYAGIVTARAVHPRHFVDSSGKPLFMIARLDVLRVFAEIPESSADKTGVGTTAVVRVPALGGREYLATITRTTRVVNPETRTLRIEIDLENTDRALAPGAYAVVQIKATTPATVLPSACVMALDEAFYVYLVENGKAVKYRIQPGRADGSFVQVLGRRSAMLTAGPWEPFTGSEQVINGNLGAVSEGTQVAVQ
jgi:multidrug efflux pump subunit AcrA (membrane-fusion protein)